MKVQLCLQISAVASSLFPTTGVDLLAKFNIRSLIAVRSLTERSTAPPTCLLVYADTKLGWAFGGRFVT